ncbi:hypothetical protein SpiGrapes_2703 [Sphaerochaeta pleomorpha str. Grapes]|uniref:Uncharacterized protein n=1 Tax=Sphaerochaeta pleomorpha (strain ATCC BAA-1885 / DSM 22778 / Grapes) TaxID=158190 RepID=G8QVE6_SPHPG|nr:hypothetical protein [Sphaerochaeta pleomorpha]AEV30461.1 hypothetical protein SpiGrapes_2703 [Sphaerochaeta pleomorpha str. Grapes]
MRKIELVAVFLLLPLFTLFALEGAVIKNFPNQVEISWGAEKNASFYDIYLDGEGLGRLPSTVLSTSVGSNEKPLCSRTDYKVIVAARDRQNSTLSYALIPFATTGWEGSYHWHNTTGSDNNGKCRDLELVVYDTDSGLSIYGDFSGNGLVLLFPLFPFMDEYPTVDYMSGDPEAIAYRLNASVFNTTSFTPKSWKLLKMESGVSSVTTVVETRVASMHFTTETTFNFQVSADGKKQVVLHNSGKGIASWGLFRCPDKEAGGDFVFTCYEPIP